MTTQTRRDYRTAHEREADAAAAAGGPRAYTLEEIKSRPPAPGMPGSPEWRKAEADREIRAFEASRAAMVRAINEAE